MCKRHPQAIEDGTNKSSAHVRLWGYIQEVRRHTVIPGEFLC